MNEESNNDGALILDEGVTVGVVWGNFRTNVQKLLFPHSVTRPQTPIEPERGRLSVPSTGGAWEVLKGSSYRQP